MTAMIWSMQQYQVNPPTVTWSLDFSNPNIGYFPVIPV